MITTEEMIKRLEHEIEDKTIFDRTPIELLSEVPLTEMNFLTLIFKNVELLDDVGKIINVNHFRTKTGRLLYPLFHEMRKSGFRNLERVAIANFCKDKPLISEKLNELGAIPKLEKLSMRSSEDNFDVYYDELLKINTLIDLNDKGFDVMKNMEKFKRMDSEQVYSFYDLVLNDTFVKKASDTEVTDMKSCDNIQEWIKKANKGLQKGTPYSRASRRLSYETNGVTDGFHLICATSGTGKTTYLCWNYILPFLEQGEKMIVIVNEQDKDMWYAMLIATIISSRLGSYELTRKRIAQGNFTAEEMELMQKAGEWLAQQKGELVLVKMYSYSLREIKKIVSRYSKLGFQKCIYDTFKADASTESSNPMWQTLLAHSQQLFQACDKNGMTLIATMQIAQRFSNDRYLNNSCISGATAVVEVASTVILLRKAWTDEIDPSSKTFLEPWDYLPDPVTGKRGKSKTMIDLDVKKKYIIAFLSKNRFGDSDIEFLYQQDAFVNNWKELGYCKVSRIGMGR